MAEDRLGSFVRYVKIFNVVAGILLVGGTIVLAATLVSRATGGGSGEARTRVALPLAAELVDAALDGDRVLLTLQDAEGSTYLLIVDSDDGSVIKRLDLEPVSE